MESLRGPVVRDVDRARHSCVVEVKDLSIITWPSATH